MEELIKRLERVIQTGAPDKNGMHPISAEVVAQPTISKIEKVGDTISRQAAITQLSHNKNKGDDEWELAVENDIQTIWKLPSAEPKWILCSEHMPEEREWIGTKRFGTTISDEVYVTFENQKGERFCKHIRFQNGKLSSADQHTIDTIYKGSKPIAWRPLPETYHEEVTE